MSKTHLAIDLSESTVRFSEITPDEGIKSSSFKFKEKTNLGYKEQLNKIISDNNYRDKSYDDYSLSWHSTSSTLIPSNVFNEVIPLDILNLSFNKKLSKSEVDYNRLPELNIVNIYELPLWVKSAFVLKFPRIIIQNENSHLIRGIIAKFSSKTRCTILLQENTFQIILSKDKQIEFNGYFNYQTNEDIIYHLMFTLQQKKWIDSLQFVTILEGHEIEKDIANELKVSLKKLLSKTTLEIEPQLIINFQELCV